MRREWRKVVTTYKWHRLSQLDDLKALRQGPTKPLLLCGVVAPAARTSLLTGRVPTGNSPIRYRKRF